MKEVIISKSNILEKLLLSNDFKRSQCISRIRMEAYVLNITKRTNDLNELSAYAYDFLSPNIISRIESETGVKIVKDSGDVFFEQCCSKKDDDKIKIIMSSRMPFYASCCIWRDKERVRMLFLN
jgi:hypothetical protein